MSGAVASPRRPPEHRRPERLYGEPVLAPGETVGSVGRRITGPALDATMRRRWWIALAGAVGLFCTVAASLAALAGLDAGGGARLLGALTRAGYGGWLGLASGSLLVSAVLLLSRVEWGCAVSRVAETAALLSAIAAGFLALVERWRPGSGTLPAWDATGLACLLAVCASLWWIGLVPDLAALRDRIAGDGRAARGLPARTCRLFARGWYGSARQWRYWVETCRSTALLGAGLAVAAQANAATELARTAAPGSPDSLLPVTLLVVAVLSGSGLTAALAVVVRAVYRLDALITGRHLDILARLILVLGLVSLYGHAWDAASIALHGDAAERAALGRRLGGVPARIVVLCELLPAQVFWLSRARRSGLAVALVGALVTVGAFADHLAITVALPGDGPSAPAGAAALAASVGLFLALLVTSLRTLPVVSIAQMRQLVLLRDTDGADDARPEGPARAASARTDTGVRGVAAAFASEKGLAAAIRALAGRARGDQLDGYGPAPMPEVLAALHAPAHPMSAYALLGALLGGFGYAAACVAGSARLGMDGPGLALLSPASWPAAGASWPFCALPCLSVAAATGTLAVAVAFLVLSRPRGSAPSALARIETDRFVLSATLESDAAAEQVVRRLSALPEADGRPLAIRRVPR